MAFGNRLLPFYVGVTIRLPGRWVAGSGEEWVLRNKFGRPSWGQTLPPRRVLLQALLSVGRAGRLPAARARPTLGLFTWGCPCPRCWGAGGPSPRDAPLCLCRGAGLWSGGSVGPGRLPLGRAEVSPGHGPVWPVCVAWSGWETGHLSVTALPPFPSSLPSPGPFPPWQLGRNLLVTRL